MPGVSLEHLEHLEHLSSWYPLVISITALSLLRKFLRKKQMKSNNLLCNDGGMTIPQIYCVYICIHRVVPGPGTTYDGVGGWGGMLTFM